MPNERPLGWDDFDVDVGIQNQGLDTKDLQNNLGGGNIFNEEMGQGNSPIIMDINKPHKIGIPYANVESLSSTFLYIFFEKILNMIEQISLMIPVKYIIKGEVDSLTMRGACVFSSVIILLIIIASMLIYAIYKCRKNRSGYNKILRYVGNNKEIPKQHIQEKKKKKY